MRVELIIHTYIRKYKQTNKIYTNQVYYIDFEYIICIKRSLCNFECLPDFYIGYTEKHSFILFHCSQWRLIDSESIRTCASLLFYIYSRLRTLRFDSVGTKRLYFFCIYIHTHTLYTHFRYKCI